MTSAPLPVDEYVRPLNLTHDEILDTPSEEVFDRITLLTARLLGMGRVSPLMTTRLFRYSVR